MKKYILAVLMMVCAFSAGAQNYGIDFQHVKWSEAVEKAKAENKLIFVDFYTQWCGPCYNMAQNVFTLPVVGEFYNQTFVNMKIDAENGEGVELAKKYGVRSYPTYMFINPATGEAVHRSSSRQTAEQFIQTGRNALNPETCSPYLESEFQKGNRDRKLLINYINYKSSVYAQKDVDAAFAELIRGGAKLTDPDVWEVYVNTISGMNEYLKQVSDNYADFCTRFTKEAVDKKLAQETGYGDLAEVEALCDFEGKAFNCEMIRINSDIRAKNYEAAAQKIDAMLSDTAVDHLLLIERLKFIARLGYYGRNVPDFWFDKCVEYLRYIAYNQTDRDDPQIHQEYAATLEKVLLRQQEGKPVPACLLKEPVWGKKTYSMRPDALKMKPVRKKK